jgi:CRP-like cAMP-binding protein
MHRPCPTIAGPAAGAQVEVIDEAEMVAALRCADLAFDEAEEDLRRLARTAQIVTFDERTTLLSPGRPNDWVYVLVSGVVEVLRAATEHNETVTLVQRGGCVGEMSALAGKPVTLNVRARSPVVALAFNGRELQKFLTEIPRLGANTALILIGRARQHIRPHVARVCLLAIPELSGFWTRVARQIADALVQYVRKVVVVELFAEAQPSSGPRAFMVEALMAEPTCSAAVEHMLGDSTEMLVTVRYGPSSCSVSRALPLIDHLAAHCDVLVVIATEPDARALAAAEALMFSRYVGLASTLHSVVAAGRFPSLPELVEHRLLLAEEPPPSNVGAIRLADQRCGTRVYSLGQAPSARNLAALARDLTGVCVGVALGAGGARGFAHIGVLERLDALGVPVDVLVGSSAGAGVGSLWHLATSLTESSS